MSRVDDATRLLARLLLAACLIPSAISKAGNISGFALSIAATGLPYPNALAAGAVIISLFGPAALAIGSLPRVTGVTLALYTAVTTLLLHPFWNFPGATRHIEQALFVANVGVVAGLLLYALTGPGEWSWQAWWRSSSEPEVEPVRQRSPRVTRVA